MIRDFAWERPGYMREELKVLEVLQELFQKHPNQFSVELLIRLIPHRQIQPGLFIHDALIMRKGVEACFSMIRAHAALAEAAEAHLAGGQMDDGVIDAAAAEAAA